MLPWWGWLLLSVFVFVPLLYVMVMLVAGWIFGYQISHNNQSGFCCHRQKGCKERLVNDNCTALHGPGWVYNNQPSPPKTLIDHSHSCGHFCSKHCHGKCKYCQPEGEYTYCSEHR